MNAMNWKDIPTECEHALEDAVAHNPGECRPGTKQMRPGNAPKIPPLSVFRDGFRSHSCRRRYVDHVESRD